MWKEKLEEIAREKGLYGEKINTGVTEKEEETFIKKVGEEINIILPSEYVAVLKIINGIEFNGFILYGVDEQMLEKTPNQHVNGFLEYNKIWYENEWQKQYIFLGESNISWYVYDIQRKKYYELDNPSGRESETFICFEDLFERLLDTSLM